MNQSKQIQSVNEKKSRIVIGVGAAVEVDKVLWRGMYVCLSGSLFAFVNSFMEAEEEEEEEARGRNPTYLLTRGVLKAILFNFP